MEKRKLNKTTVDALQYDGPGGRHSLVVWDIDLAGYGIRLYPSGAKVFVVKYRTNNRQRFFVIGKYGAFTPDQARKAAKALLGKIATGDDPQATKEQAAAGGTMGELCALYMERHSIPHKLTWGDDEGRIARHILPRWKSIKADSITRSDVAALHSAIGKKSGVYEANRTLSLISNMFAQARRWGITPETKANPAGDITKFKEHQRDRWVTHEELPRLALAINEEPNESARAVIWLYLLTGCRKKELLPARWDQVDLARNELRLPKTKAGRLHYVPLSEPALALLAGMPRTEGNPHIFPGKLAGEPLKNIARPWNRVRRAAGIEDVRLHDLRRTVGSWLAQSGNSLHLIGRVLNHSNVSTTAIYARFSENHAATALEAHGRQIMGAAGLQPSGEVVDFKAKKKGQAGSAEQIKEK